MVIKLFVTAIFTLLISGCSQQWYTEYGIPNDRALTDKESLPKLIEAMQDSEPNIRINAMRQVLRFGEDAKDAIPSFISTLDDNVDNVRIYAVRSLARFGYDARAAIPKLQEMAENDNNKKIRFDAGDALKRITRSPEPKLEKIKELYERGLITKEEYDQKRKEILDAM